MVESITNHRGLLNFHAMFVLICLGGCAHLMKPKMMPVSAPVATANAAELQRMTHSPAPEYAPRVSPDAKTMLFHVVDKAKYGWDSNSIALITFGKSGRKLIAGPGAGWASWYPDGKHLVYVYYKTPKHTLVRSPYGAAGMTFITPSAMGGRDNQPVVSPDGGVIAFGTDIGGKSKICTVNDDGSSFTLYVDGKSPKWHPTTKLLVFSRSVGTKYHDQIFTVDLPSGQVTQLTSGNFNNSFPVWSPDGKWVAFASDRDGKSHIYAMKSDGSSVTQLTRGNSEEGTPDWGSDGRVYFSSNAGAPKEVFIGNWHHVYSDIWRIKPVMPKLTTKIPKPKSEPKDLPQKTAP